MIKFERKKINNKPYYYLTDQVKIGKKTKKIQVFVGKKIPNDTGAYFTSLQQKELDETKAVLKKSEISTKYLKNYSILKIESGRINWKYYKAQITQAAYSRLLRNFAIQFIFESNAIEGSRLDKSEVEAIVKKKYRKKRLPQEEVTEVENSIKCFDYINSEDFILNHKSIIKLHTMLIENLNIPTGFKTSKIVVNNKNTADPKKVRKELTNLISWYKNEKKKLHPFERAVIFHNRFERIHPFTDGNGRVGRLILNWMLLHDGYGYVLIKDKNKTAYKNALDKGDTISYRNILLFCAREYDDTINEFVISN